MNTNILFSAFAAIVSSIILFKHPIFTKYYTGKPIVDIAELLVTNASIYTSDLFLPFADSIAIKHGHILAVGNFSSLQAFEGSTTERLDLKGKVVVPGFIDSHVHFLSGGLQMAQVELHGVSTKQEFIKKIEASAKS